jgi:hypothetical protein
MSPDTCVVVPTIREFECMRAYFENAREHGFDLDRLFVLLVTEDFCETEAMEAMLREEGVAGAVFDGSRRAEWFADRDVVEFSHVIPDASHAETSFGLLYMWANPRFEYGFFIDDDTLPHENFDFFGRHFENLTYDGGLEEIGSSTQWVNVLYQDFDEHGLYPRGYPYSAMDEEVERGTREANDVVASQGLWTNVPDLDAVRILLDGDLEGQAQTRLEAAHYDGDFLAARGNYLTVCSMNLAFKREVIPAFYQLPMDDNPWNVGRFDDIWSGVFLKRACDVLDKDIYNGAPLCVHNKAPRSTFSDLNNEVPALELNEHVWEIADGAGATADSYAEVFAAIATALTRGDYSEYENGDFLTFVGEHMFDWLDCLDALAPGTVPEARATTTD